jgi:hypothetical protein
MTWGHVYSEAGYRELHQGSACCTGKYGTAVWRWRSFAGTVHSTTTVTDPPGLLTPFVRDGLTGVLLS